MMCYHCICLGYKTDVLSHTYVMRLTTSVYEATKENLRFPHLRELLQAYQLWAKDRCKLWFLDFPFPVLFYFLISQHTLL